MSERDLTKADMALLARAFEAEISGALSKSGIHTFQTRSKRAAALVEGGYLELREEKLRGRFPVTVRGYALTELGRLSYCMSEDA